MIILSILMCTIPEREEKAVLLFSQAAKQIADLHYDHPTLGRIEINYDNSKSFLKGGLSIGKKREGLVRKAEGKYLCSLDDDEDISPNYVETLVRLCNEDKDVVTFRSFAKTDFYWTVIDMSLENKVNEEATPERIIKRPPWHVCPVKSEYAKLYEFEDINYGEDFNWMEKVLTHCKTEAKTNQILHCYNHSSKHSEADKIMKHENSNF